jgi:predicted O-linked N-acetylglucosamine transferase (SPINDLY family)
MVAADENHYIKLAARLADDRAGLALLRQELRDRVSRSVLCDAPAMAHRFGVALIGAWARRPVAIQRPPVMPDRQVSS